MADASPVSDWDFRGADTKQFTHCLHAYPAMMIPQIAGRLIDSYGRGARLLLDPYCGSGTSLVEANLRDISAVGSDLNPLARLIASAKTRKIPLDKAARRLREMKDRLLGESFGGGPDAEAPAPPGADFWFPPDARRKLAAIKRCIGRVRDADIRNFFLVAFSETARECSYTRNGEFKLYRMAEGRREKFRPDVFGVFAAKLDRNFAGLRRFIAAASNAAQTRVCGFNSVWGIPAEAAPPESADIVVTSPPYGDSGTTVAYGQFSRLANEWLEHENAAAVDRILMGGRKPKEVFPLGDSELDEAVKKIAEGHPKRAAEICGFYRDYRRSIAHVAATVRPGGFACYVVGNRKVKGVVLPTDRATESYFRENGFAREDVFIRNIPNKRMPSRNSPSNVPGAVDSTMCREHIVVMRKPNRGRGRASTPRRA